ncbi:MAG: KTSC domain-containing protein [Chitinophagaceae bacterium]|nr:KTSC domain-containing protein [Chitinophagaceae bacterium]
MPSGVIAAIEYQADGQVLQVTFVSGLVYHYLEVPEAIYAGLNNAWSKGRYFNRFIKDRYAARRVQKEDDH